MNEGKFLVLVFDRLGSPEQCAYHDFKWRADCGLDKNNEKTAFRFKWELLCYDISNNVIITYIAEDQFIDIDVRNIKLHQFKNFMLGSFFKYNKEFTKYFKSYPISSVSDNIKEDEIIKSWENLIL